MKHKNGFLAYLAQPLMNNWGRVGGEGEAGPEATPGEPTPAPEPTPVTTVNVESEPFVMPEKLKGKTDEEIAKIYVDLEKQHGTTTNEVGALRVYKDHYNSKYMVDPNNPDGEPIHRGEYEAQQAAQPPRQEGQLSDDELADKMREFQDEDPVGYHNMEVQAATQEFQKAQATRNAAFATPEATKVLTDHPDVGQRAEQISIDMNIPLESALHMAYGEKEMGSAPGGNQPAITPPGPQVNLAGLTTKERAFMGPQGRIPETELKSKLTPEQIARGKEIWGLKPEQMERFAIPKEKR